MLLSTWNFARFRYAVTKFDIDHFRHTILQLVRQFEALRNVSIQTFNTKDHRNAVTEIFIKLSKIKGIEFTGAPKLLHLRNPELFVMWDDYIRGAKPKRFYSKLPIFKNGICPIKQYERSAEGYVVFLEDMQKQFGHLRADDNSKTLAKAIDEFNYMQITLPLMEMEKRERSKH